MPFHPPDAPLAAALDALEHGGIIPCAPAPAASFARRLPEGDVYLYPAGQDAATLLQALDQEPGGPRVVGVIDRSAPEEGEDERRFFGRRLIAPTTFAAMADARVLICHSQRETELLGILRGLGVGEDRIETIFSHPGYREQAESPAAAAAVLNALGARPSPRNVIIRAERSGVIVDDAALATALAPDETIILNIAAPVERIASQVYQTIDLYRSLGTLRRVLEQIAPQTVYLQLNLHSVHFAALVRRIVPRAVLIYEMWDLWLASVGDLRPEDYGRLVGMDDAMVDLSQRSERYLLDSADLLISKRGGPTWEAQSRRFGAPCLQYFARVGAGGTPPAAATGQGPATAPQRDGLRLLFAATFQTLENLDALDYIRPNQDHRAVFAALTADGRTTVDLYNAAHRDEGLDPLYASYLDAYREGPIRYHRRVPPAQLLAAMDEYDYGWIRATPAVPSVDCHVVIPASLSSYIAAGLPAIVHATLTYASDLISQFDAGVVVPADEAGEQAVRRVRAAADPPRHRAGARRLRAYMLERNQQLLEAVKALNGERSRR